MDNLTDQQHIEKRLLACRELAVLRAALIKCREQFSFYETQHLTKNTEDGNEKASTNRTFKLMCDAALEGTQ